MTNQAAAVPVNGHARNHRFALLSAIVSIACVLLNPFVIEVAATVFDETVPPGGNFDKADFRLWLPDAVPAVRAVLVLMPGSNGDGRGQVEDPVWQEFAASRRLALLGVRLTDRKHEQPFIEHYADVAQGSGQALLDALTALSGRSGHPELASAPFLMWGMSAGGEFNYEFVNWKPERVIGFVVNKGGIYYSAVGARRRAWRRTCGRTLA